MDGDQELETPMDGLRRASNAALTNQSLAPEVRRASVGTCASNSTSNSKALNPVPQQTFSKRVLCGWHCNRDVLMGKTEAVPALWELQRSNWCSVTPPVATSDHQ